MLQPVRNKTKNRDAITRIPILIIRKGRLSSPLPFEL
jgi:hypothetical protein